MKVNVTHSAKVQKLLDEVNGQATEHTASVTEIQLKAKETENRLVSFGITKEDREGAYIKNLSGNSLKGYRYKVIRTFYTLERGKKDWFIVACRKEKYGSSLPSWSGIIYIHQAKIDKAVRSKKILANLESREAVASYLGAV